MSYLVSDESDVAHQQYMRKRTWIVWGGLMLLLMIGLAILNYVGERTASEVGGGVTIEAEPDTRIYIGERLVGTTQITLTWQELFGNESQNPIATEMRSASSVVTPELLSGPGAVELDSRILSGSKEFGTADKKKMNDSRFDCFIRRANGDLDLVVPIVIDWVPDNEPARRYLLPVRLRKGPAPSTVYFSETFSQNSSRGAAGFMIALGLSRNEIIRKWRFTANRPPEKFEEHIRTKGLWEPEAK